MFGPLEATPALRWSRGSGRGSLQPFPELGPPRTARRILDCDGDRLGLPHQHHEPFASRAAGDQRRDADAEVAPGSTSTPGWHELAASEEDHRQMIRFVESTTPAGRLGDVDEIARAALFLASDDSSFVNGSELFVDGGSAQI